MPDNAQNVPAVVAPRHALILERLRAQPMVEVNALAEDLGVTAVTIRSDLDALDRKQLLRRIRGGAMAVRPARFEPPADLPGQSLDAEKARIGAMAARMIRSGETIILDAGSTAMAVALALPVDLRDVLVVTSSLDIAITLHPHVGISILVTGGKLKETGRNRTARSLISPFGTLLLDQINADCAFVCCTGIDARRGFTNASLEEIEIKRAMIRASRRVVMLGDASKIGHVAGARIADAAEVTTLVTNAGAQPADVAALEATGLQVLLA
jgi:DeoR/GlpR family transcriptional regulator of sugar metabolism